MKQEKQSAQEEAAKKYVDEQLEVLRKYGAAAPLSKENYKDIVQKVVRASQQ